MTVQTRRYRNTARNAFLALVAVLAILGATLATSGPSRAAHAAPTLAGHSMAVQGAQGATGATNAQAPFGLGITLTKMTPAQQAAAAAKSAAHIRSQVLKTHASKLRPLYNECDITTWIAIHQYTGTYYNSGGIQYSLFATLWVLVDYYSNDIFCGSAQAEGNDRLDSGCAHFEGDVYSAWLQGPVPSSSYDVYHCTATWYDFTGPRVDFVYCPGGGNFFLGSENWTQEGGKGKANVINWTCLQYF